MLARFKQQAQETGAFLKKQQQTFSQQVQKGIKMATNSAQKKENPLEHPQEAPIASTAAVGHREEQSYMRNPEQVGLDQMGEWTSALAQMGFKRSHICEAAGMLGGQPQHMEDLLQAVLAIAASEEKDICSSASSSSMPSSSGLAEARLASEALPADAEPKPSIDKDVPLATQQPPLPAALSPSLEPCLFASENVVVAEDKMMQSAPPKLDVAIVETSLVVHAEPEKLPASAEVLHDIAAAESEEQQKNLRAPDLAQIQVSTKDFQSQRSLRAPDWAQIQVSTKDLAAAIVASAIAKASAKEAPSAQTVTKHLVEHPSPVRGGA
jgi:hypothetical protein